MNRRKFCALASLIPFIPKRLLEARPVSKVAWFYHPPGLTGDYRGEVASIGLKFFIGEDQWGTFTRFRYSGYDGCGDVLNMIFPTEKDVENATKLLLEQVSTLLEEEHGSFREFAVLAKADIDEFLSPLSQIAKQTYPYSGLVLVMNRLKESLDEWMDRSRLRWDSRLLG